MAAGIAPFNPGTAIEPSTQVEISVSCRNLRDRDVFSKSDPVCILYTKNFKSDTFYEYGRTETISNTLNPNFIHKFIISYYFEEYQQLKFELYDIDSEHGSLDQQDFLGYMECTLGELVGCGSQLKKKLLRRDNENNDNGNIDNGVIILRAEEVNVCKDKLSLNFQATNLDRKDIFGKSDPFLIFYRANEDNSFTAVHKTEFIRKTLNPTWKPFSLMANVLCNGDYHRVIKVECYDWDRDGGHDFIGEFTTNLQTLMRGAGPDNIYQLINPNKRARKKNYKNSGEVRLLFCKVETIHSFLDYITSGRTQLNFTVAIDFTASNGNPSNPTSLHFYNPYQMNQYAAAIKAVGEIIQDYDSDKLFPTFGFGARLPDGTVSHEFALNRDPQNPYCAGIPAIMQAYYDSLQRVQLYGPTNFSPIINHVAKFASNIEDGSHYFILLIITDGVITDLNQTVRSIVQASYLPMSIIIVGVGNADFEAMNTLDGDEGLLRSGERLAQRDIVQFVPFRDFLGDHGSRMQVSQAYLAREVLAEIPEQFLSYMKHHRIKPILPTKD
ncbi:copine-8-like [Argonauta hians]